MKHLLKPVLTALFLLPFAAVAAAPQARPNFLFILVDDLGIKDLGVEGSQFYETPRIDSLAHESMRFTNGYAACTVCSPSRASILLGQYPTRHGITNWIGEEVGRAFARERQTKLLVPDYVRKLPAETTLPSALKEDGYATFFAGKWHLGGEDAWPENRGFDINKGGWDSGGPTGGKGGYYAPWKNPRLPSGPDGQSLTLRLADETIGFIEQNAGHPFLAYLSFYAVHGPIQTTRERWEKFRAKAAAAPAPAERFAIDRTLPVRQVQDNPVYAGLVAEMDDAVGRVLQKLEDLRLSDNTIVVFTSDNGGVTSGDSFSSALLPYRGGKGRQWEGGVRVPYFIKAPGIARPGSTCDTPVSGIDFFPTLLALAGVTPPPSHPVDGVNLLPLLQGGSIAPRPLFWHYPHYGNQGGEPSSIIRRGDWKLIHYWEDDRNELYHLAADLGEQHDLATKEPARTTELWTELHAWLVQTNAKIPQPNPDYNPAWAAQKQQAALKQKERLEKEHAAILQPDWQPDPTWWNSRTTRD